jgi:hypothetical protein
MDMLHLYIQQICQLVILLQFPTDCFRRYLASHRLAPLFNYLLHLSSLLICLVVDEDGALEDAEVDDD